MRNAGRPNAFAEKSKRKHRPGGVEPKIKPIGRPVIYNTPDEALLARRAADRASKARQAERISEAIRAAIGKNEPPTAQNDLPTT